MPSNRTSLGALLLVTLVALAGLFFAYDAMARDGRGGSVSKAIGKTLG
jgi:ABC-type glucose/galactose transport system permease subunit